MSPCGSERRNALCHSHGSYSYEPAPEWNGTNWSAVVVITKEHQGWRKQKRFSSELSFDSQREAYDESMALGQSIIYRIISGAEEF